VHSGLPEPLPLGTPMVPPGTFAGVPALITCGGTGLGRAMAAEFARRGAGVGIASRGGEGRRREPHQVAGRGVGTDGIRVNDLATGLFPHEEMRADLKALRADPAEDARRRCAAAAATRSAGPPPTCALRSPPSSPATPKSSTVMYVRSVTAGSMSR